MLKLWSASRKLFSNDFLSFLNGESSEDRLNSDLESMRHKKP